MACCWSRIAAVAARLPRPRRSLSEVYVSQGARAGADQIGRDIVLAILAATASSIRSPYAGLGQCARRRFLRLRERHKQPESLRRTGVGHEEAQPPQGRHGWVATSWRQHGCEFRIAGRQQRGQRLLPAPGTSEPRAQSLRRGQQRAEGSPKTTQASARSERRLGICARLA